MGVIWDLSSQITRLYIRSFDRGSIIHSVDGSSYEPGRTLPLVLRQDGRRVTGPRSVPAPPNVLSPGQNDLHQKIM